MPRARSHTQRVRRRIFAGLGIVIAVLALFLVPSSIGIAEDADEGAIRVGFFEFSGYQDETEDGQRSGYSYDFLQKLQSYLPLPLEYVDYDISFSDSLDLLEQGELDLMATITKTSEREERFLFSDEPMGTEATNLTIKAGNEEIIPGDYDTYDGMVVGILDGNTAYESLEALAEEKGFSYEPFMFETEEELIKALDDGIVDAILVSSIRNTDGEWLLETFEPTDIYVVANREDGELMDLVNAAIASMDVADPEWREELAAKYKIVGATVSLDADERAYLEGLASEGRSLTVLASPDHEPYSYFTEQGEADGIFPALFDVIATKVGLPYTYLAPADNAAYEEMIADGEADIVLDVPDDAETAELMGLKLTDPYMSESFARILRRDFRGEPQSIGLVQGDYSELVGYLDSAYPADAIRTFDTGEAAIEALRAGEVDAVIAHLRSAESLVLDDPRGSLIYTLLGIPAETYAIGVKESEPDVLVTLLNQGIASIDSASAGSVIANETALAERPMAPLVYLSLHPFLAGVCVVALQAAVGVIVFLVTRAYDKRRWGGGGDGGVAGGRRAGGTAGETAGGAAEVESSDGQR